MALKHIRPVQLVSYGIDNKPEIYFTADNLVDILAELFKQIVEDENLVTQFDIAFRARAIEFDDEPLRSFFEPFISDLLFEAAGILPTEPQFILNKNARDYNAVFQYTQALAEYLRQSAEQFAEVHDMQITQDLRLKGLLETKINTDYTTTLVRNCQECGGEFVAKQVNAKYCSAVCRKKAANYRSRHGVQHQHESST